MSKTYSIACIKCKKHVWIGQSYSDKLSLYFGEKDTMDLLVKFLWEHKGHDLLFDENCESIIGDFEEIE